MKYFYALLSLAATVALTYTLNNKLGPAPAFGKFLNPFQGFWQNAVAEKQFNNCEGSIAGLKDEVQVVYDERLVPHIEAKNDEDLYFMQGYITAKHRLWQMEISTHAAAGRVSEIVGEKALDNDRLMRRIGMGIGAESAQAFIEKDEESKKMLKAYCNGINAYIKNLSPRNYPIEYKLLGYAPEEWQSIKVALLLKNMANMLSIFEYDIQNTAFIERYGMEEFRKLYPDFIDAEDPIIPAPQPPMGELKTSKSKLSSTSLQNQNLSRPSPFALRPAPHIGLQTLDIRHRTSDTRLQTASITNPFHPTDDVAMASNNWAVAGSKTATGKPILCNDPHLKLSLPSIWYEMHLKSPTVNVYGATLPGAPAVIIGFNDSIAWGVTNGGRDVRDWFKTEFQDNTRTAYKLDGEWQSTSFRIEKFKIAGKGEFVDTIVMTKFGPVVYDRTFGESSIKKNLAMKWTAHLPSNEFMTFHKMNRGKNYDDYQAALQHFTCPSQNFVFACANGDIAIQQQGKFPFRNRATEQGKYILESKSENDWTDYIPYAENPHVKNPERGFVSSANQHPTDENYQHYYPGVGVYENYRNRVINDILRKSGNITASDMMKMQDNNYFLLAAEALPVLFKLLDEGKLNAEEQQVLNVMKTWTHYNNPEELAPVYFEIWWNELRRMLFDELQDPKLSMKQPTFYVIVQMLANDSTSVFYDNQATPEKETREDLVMQSFKVIAESIRKNEFIEVHEPYGVDVPHKLDDVSNLDWGKYKATKVEHLARLDAFSSLNVYNGGNLGVINATNSTNGPSWRMVVDFGERKGYVVYPGGQSGNPGSKFYDNMVSTWAKGEFYTASFFGESVKPVYTERYKPMK